MLAIAIHSQVVNFPFFGQASTDRDTLMNGVTTPFSEFWSTPLNLAQQVEFIPPHKTCLTSYFCHSPQGSACINFKAAVLPLLKTGDRVGVRLLGSYSLMSAWVNRGQIAKRLRSF
jgi:hypothetical protein